MNLQLFEYYSNYITAPFVATIVGASMVLFAVITLILAICLFKNKNRGLYAATKTFSIIGLIVSVLLTITYITAIALIALSSELFSYTGGGVIGSIRDLTCGIFLAPTKFGVTYATSTINTAVPFIFYTITIFAPAVLGFIAFIVSCLAQRSSRKARRSAAAVTPLNVAPINNPVNNNIQSMPQPQPVPVPAAAPAPVPAPIPSPAPVAEDNTPIDEAPIKKLVPDSAEEVPAEKVEEAPAEKAEEAPAEKTEEAPAEKTEEAPAEKTEEAPAEKTEETPAEKTEEAPAEKTEEAPAEKVEEKPINEDKILNLMSAPPAENTVANDKPLFCMNCGSALNGGAFCINCGTPAVSKAKTCKSCNAELAEDAKFCMICGAKVE